MNLRPSGYELAESHDGLCPSVPLGAADQHFYRGVVMVGKGEIARRAGPSGRRSGRRSERPEGGGVGCGFSGVSGGPPWGDPHLPHHRVDGIPPRARGVSAHRCPIDRPHTAGHLSAIDVGRQDGCRSLRQLPTGPIEVAEPELGSSPPLSGARRFGAVLRVENGVFSGRSPAGALTNSVGHGR